jgi:hypothetical protein
VLTGKYAARAAKTYKTKEGRELLASVRMVLSAMDNAMRGPSTPERGRRIGQIMTALDLAADRYDLFGEKPRKPRGNNANHPRPTP